MMRPEASKLIDAWEDPANPRGLGTPESRFSVFPFALAMRLPGVCPPVHHAPVQPSPHPLDARIPAHTRRQAMDWSLVLASQGIEHVIDRDEATGWTLAVSAVDHEKALTVIRLYREENLHWRWRRPVFQPGLFFDWSSLAWVWLVILFYGWSEARPALRHVGMMTGAALAHGEWWRLFTATWLHADVGHLASNIVFGFLFLGLAMARYGP